MNKAQKHKEIMEVVRQKYPYFKSLDVSNDLHIHVRIEGFGDVWPTTGTAKVKGIGWIKRDAKAVICALRGGEIIDTPKKKTNRDRFEELESRIQELEERNCWLEDEVSKLKTFLNV